MLVAWSLPTAKRKRPSKKKGTEGREPRRTKSYTADNGEPSPSSSSYSPPTISSVHTSPLLAEELGELQFFPPLPLPHELEQSEVLAFSLDFDADYPAFEQQENGLGPLLQSTPHLQLPQQPRLSTPLPAPQRFNIQQLEVIQQQQEAFWRQYRIKQPQEHLPPY